MNRTAVNLVVDLSAAALFVGTIATGYILGFALPPGTNKLWYLWGLTRHQWGTIHFGISLGFLGVMLLHVCLHWQWLVSVAGRRLRLATPARGGLVRSGLVSFLLLAAILGLFAWATQTGVREITDPVQLGVCPPPVEGGGGAGDGEAAPPGTAEAGGRAPVAFWTDVYPVLEKSCLSCHGPRRQRGAFRVDRREDFFRADGRAALVVPGRSADSPLIALVSGLRTDVPRADVHKLSEKDVALLKAWIDAGAEWPDRADRE